MAPREVFVGGGSVGLASALIAEEQKREKYRKWYYLADFTKNH